MQLASEIERQHPQITKIIRKDLYFDDLVTDADSIEEVIAISNKVSEAFSTACFKLRKWVYNDPKAVEGMIRSDKYPDHVNFSSSSQKYCFKNCGMKTFHGTNPFHSKYISVG